MKTILSILLLSIGTLSGAFAQDIESKVKSLVSQMTLEEKASLCSGRDPWSTKPVERLDIPWIWMSDGPHGLRRAPSTDKWGYGDQLPATCFPTASALAATWDTDLVYQVGQALGKESQAIDVNILLGPGVNIKRSVLGGRNFEFFSEDPILSGQLGVAYINGVQSQGVGTSLKHYVANNVETWRMYMDSDVDKRTLHEIYLRPFEMAVKEAKPWTVMACYNRVQGTYGSQSPYLLTQVLREDWGYEGIVISDWEAVVNRVEALKAGLDIQMPGRDAAFNDQMIVKAVQNKELDEAVLDETVSSILRIVLKAKANEKKVKMPVKEHHQLARKVASEAVTLLKNENDVLPLSGDKYKNVAIIGEFAVNTRYQGNGSSEVKPAKVDKFLEMIKKEYGKQVNISYAQGYQLKDDQDMSLIDEAVAVASKADIAIIMAGLPLHYESEGIDRKHIDIPQSHNELISRITKVQENTVVTLTNGSAVAMPWVDEVDGIVEGWLAGQAGAGAIADVLFGTVNPSGKLAETFPVRLEDTPAYLNFPGEQGTVLYGERIYVGYRYYDARAIEPLFPFGHGLSYTSFEYSDIQVSANSITDKDKLTVSATITNTGSVKGKEIIQLYVSDKQSVLQRPEKELKGFTKIELQAGESQKISFELDFRSFAYFDARKDMWVVESGTFDIMLGASSRDIRLTASVDINSTQKVPLAFDEYTFFTSYWANPQTRELLKELIPNWIKRHTPEGKSMDEAQFESFMSDQPMIKYPYFTGGEISKKEVMELVERCKSFTTTL
ncbi:beta-glucosidase family protein [Reichenbachiella ulvae]|uniref:Glycoside hydrolase family 3 C-terminal domain-containing protein n=1 Tax=Reichenbachiella ulvae TaxID=2980104 RepID=A0ABT3CPY2_9BACT|nr:glycoside hydrolase family 3 C-terminal domain-containing protein [Reichenbachiella ulvae]MCV9385515.1 glycoside hydrolase family 3 C-terminal domain-containing protein [Reichenbachiella ulvae]